MKFKIPDKEFFSKPRVKKDAEVLIIGLIMIAAGIFFFMDTMGSYKKTEAVITSINYVAEDNVHQLSDPNVCVDYSAAGTEYKNVPLKSANSEMRIGDTVVIEYDTNDASRIRTKSDVIMPYMLFISGGIVSLLGCFYIIQDMFCFEEFKDEEEEPEEDLITQWSKKIFSGSSK